MDSAANDTTTSTAPPPKVTGRGRRTMASGTHSGESETAQWERDWRSDMAHDMAVSAERHERTALILERVNGRLDDHDRRLGALEGKPAQEQRASLDRFHVLTQGGGCLYMTIYGCISIITLVISAIIALAPHLGWH